MSQFIEIPQNRSKQEMKSKQACLLKKKNKKRDGIYQTNVKSVTNLAQKETKVTKCPIGTQPLG